MLEGISNHYFLGMERPKLETELHLVFQPTEAWNYAHHYVHWQRRFCPLG